MDCLAESERFPVENMLSAPELQENVQDNPFFNSFLSRPFQEVLQILPDNLSLFCEILQQNRFL